MKYELHPACAAWPPMNDDAILKLAEDIKINGLIEDVTLTKDGRMLDGRSRAMACEMAGIALRTVIYDGDDEVSFVISKNLHRRHLSSVELAMIAADMATLKRGKYLRKENTYVSAETYDSSSITKTAGVISKEMGISRAAIMDAKAIKDNATAEIVDLVKTGRVGMRSAAAYVRNITDKSEQKASPAEIRRVGGAINNGKIQGKKKKRGSSVSPSPSCGGWKLKPTFLDMTDEDAKGLDPNQRVHLHSYTAKQMIDAQTLVTEMLHGMVICARATNPDPEMFFAALDKLLAWKPKPGGKHGEQLDYAKGARQSLNDLERVLPVAFAKLQAFYTEWLRRKNHAA